MIRQSVLALLVLISPFASLARAQTQNVSQSLLISRPLTLAQAEELLRIRNLAVSANRHQLDASRAGRLIAGFRPNPVLTLGAQQFPFTSNVAGSAPRWVSTNPDAGANPVFTAHIDKIIERGEKREFRIAQADAVVDATVAQIEDTLRIQLFQLRQVFVAALLARDNLQLATQLQSQYGQTTTLIAARVEAGSLAPVDLYRIQAASLPFQQAVIDAQSSYEQATRDVLNLLDIAPDDLTTRSASTNVARAVNARRETDRVPAHEASTQSLLGQGLLQLEGTFGDKVVAAPLDELRRLALANRPDVRMARSTRDAAMSASRLAQAQRTRDVVVGVEYQRVGNDQAAGMTMQIPLFLYNNQTAGVTQAAALERSADAQLRQAERQAVTDVEKAYQAYLGASRVLALYNDANLKQVQDVRSVSEYTYQRGAVSLVELLDAERMIRQTLMAFNQARASYQLALFQLEQAIGVPLP